MRGYRALFGAVLAWTVAVLAGMALLASISSLATARAEPAAGCTAAAIDTTDDHLFDTERIADAARDMGNRTGLDVYVRTFEEMPYGDAGVWWRNAYKECPAWLATDGVHPKPNVLVVAVSLDRKSAIEYGEAVTKLDGDVDSIRGQTLGDALRDANAASDRREGFTVAIEKTLAALEAEYTAKPFDWGKVWSWVVTAVLSLAGVAASVWGVFLTRSGIRSRRAKSVLRREIAAARAESTDAVMDSDTKVAEHFFDTEVVLEEVEGDYTPYPSRAQVIERINEFSAENAALLDLELPTSIEGLTDIRDGFRSVTAGITRALYDAESRTTNTRAEAKRCTRESKDADLKGALSNADRARGALSAAPTWFDTSVVSAVLTVATDSASNLVGGTASRADVDAAVGKVDAAIITANAALSEARAAGDGVEALARDAKGSLTLYRDRPPADVKESTVRAVVSALEKLNERIAEERDRLTPSAGSGAKLHLAGDIVRRTAALRAKLREALSPAEAQIAAAEAERFAANARLPRTQPAGVVRRKKKIAADPTAPVSARGTARVGVSAAGPAAGAVGVSAAGHRGAGSVPKPLRDTRWRIP